MSNFLFKTEDYILYILKKLEPENSNKLKLNKIAFFAEFGYIYKRRKPLSEAQYAGITYGPAIDDYLPILKKMEAEGKIFIDGNTVRPLVSPNVDVPEEVSTIIDPLIEKYSRLSLDELLAIAHKTDSYVITTQNEKVYGKVIDKNLAHLETFFEDKENEEEQIAESDLPTLSKDALKPYELG